MCLCHLKSLYLCLRSIINRLPIAFVFIVLAIPAAKASGTSGNIVVNALVQNSSPKYVQGTSGVEGICGEFYLQLGKELEAQGIEVVIDDHYTPIKRILKTLRTTSNSIYCGASRDPEREKIYQYSSLPLYMVSNILVTHQKNRKNPDTVQELIRSKARIGTYFGTGSAKFLKSTGVQRVNERYATLEKGLQSVASGEIDYFFYHDLGLLYFLSQTSLELRAVPTAFRSYAHWMIMSPDMPEEIFRKLDATVSKLIKNGTMTQIRKGYEPD